MHRLIYRPLLLLCSLAASGLLQAADTPSDQHVNDAAIQPIVALNTDATLSVELQAALAEMPTDYRPRTEHFLADGRPKYINRLILEESPYLLQHAHNPVNWYPFDESAFRDQSRS